MSEWLWYGVELKGCWSQETCWLCCDGKRVKKIAVLRKISLAPSFSNNPKAPMEIPECWGERRLLKIS